MEHSEPGAQQLPPSPLSGVPAAGPPVPADDLPPPLAAVEQALFPSPSLYSSSELAAAAGVELAVAERLWRAMGFTVRPTDEKLFGEDDLKALLTAVHALQSGTSLDTLVYQTRVTAAALSRAAEVWSDEIMDRVARMRDTGLDDEQIAEALHRTDFPEIDRIVGYFYRRQLKAALWRKLAEPDRPAEATPLTVGFVDLVRFTALTEDIDEESLGEMIDRFESVVHDRVTDRGGRIVKMIGDEVMFVSTGMKDAIETALRLVQDFTDDESVPPARAGLAAGLVLPHGGDYFGPVVNLAARIVDVARPSSVVVSREIHDALVSAPDLHWRRLPPRRLKGIGLAALWAVSEKRPAGRSLWHRDERRNYPRNAEVDVDVNSSR